MASVNKVIVVGRIGQPLELKRTQGGVAFLNFSMATSEKYTDKQGQKQEQTEWHNISAWNKSAEIIAQYCGKGSLLYVEGKLKTDTYEKDGQKHYSTKIVVREFQFLGSKQDNQQQQNGGGFGQQQQQNNGWNVPQHQEFQNNAPQQQHMSNNFGQGGRQ